MLDVLIGGGILAAATGLAVIAYERPAAFEKMFWWAAGVIALAEVLAIAWFVGSAQMYSVLVRFVPSEKLAVADSAFQGASEVLWKALASSFVAVVFIIILRALPLLGAVADSGPAKRDDTGDKPST